MAKLKIQDKQSGQWSIVYSLLYKRKAHTIDYRLSTIDQFAFILLFCFLFSVCYAQDQFIYDSKSKRNPFIPLVTPDGMLLKLDKEEGSGNLSIEGIIYDKNGRSYAIVNGTVVEIGDFVSGYQVLKIEENKIIFIKEGQATEVKFKKEE